VYIIFEHPKGLAPLKMLSSFNQQGILFLW
jgi:hypothetical protein